MQEPIQSGDRCKVIDGLKGNDSPNIGLIVIVGQYVGDHSQYGRIWRCKSEYAERAQTGTDNVPPGTLDFAAAWLRKIPKAPLPVKTKEAVT